MVNRPGSCSIDGVPRVPGYRVPDRGFGQFGTWGGHLLMDGARRVSVGVVIRPSVI